jgi:uncharacterized protein YggT (Ycf19 family)
MRAFRRRIDCETKMQMIKTPLGTLVVIVAMLGRPDIAHATKLPFGMCEDGSCLLFVVILLVLLAMLDWLIGGCLGYIGRILDRIVHRLLGPTRRWRQTFSGNTLMLLAVACAVGLIVVFSVLSALPHSIDAPVREETATQQVQQGEAAGCASRDPSDALLPSLRALGPALLESVPGDPWGSLSVSTRSRHEAHIGCHDRDGRQGGQDGLEVDIAACLSLPGGTP